MGQKEIIWFLVYRLPRWKSGLSSASWNYLTTFRPLRMFKIVFRDS